MCMSRFYMWTSFVHMCHDSCATYYKFPEKYRINKKKNEFQIKKKSWQEKIDIKIILKLDFQSKKEKNYLL